MRLLSTVLLCVFLVGGTWIYLNVDKQIKKEAAEVLYAKASGITMVSIERTFQCYGDKDFDEPAIKVRFGGEDVYLNESDSVAANEPIEFELEGVEELENTITVTANATDPDSFGDDAVPLRAMVVRISYSDKLVAEEFFHADGSAISLNGDVTFRIPEEEKDDHAH